MTATITNTAGALTLNNLDAVSTTTSFSTQSAQTQTDLNNLNNDAAQLKALQGTPNLTSAQAQQAVALSGKLQKDAAQFQSDQKLLLQIAVTDQSGDEAGIAENQFGQAGNADIASAAASAQDLETHHALDNALGGTNNYNIGTYHQNVDAAVSSANAVGVQDGFTNYAGTFTSGVLAAPWQTGATPTTAAAAGGAGGAGGGTNEAQNWQSSPYAQALTGPTTSTGQALLVNDAQSVQQDVATYNQVTSLAAQSGDNSLVPVETETLHNDELYFWQDKQTVDQASGDSAAAAQDTAEVSAFTNDASKLDVYSTSSSS